MMDNADQYSEKIAFSPYGVRMAIIDAKGTVIHQDNWEPEMFGGFLPAVGDYVTTLWDPLRPEPAEHYQVVARYYIGELMGDNCWWLLLEEAKPNARDQALFKLAREQSAKTRSLTGSYDTLVQLRELLEKKKPLRNGNSKSPRPKPG